MLAFLFEQWPVVAYVASCGWTYVLVNHTPEVK